MWLKERFFHIFTEGWKCQNCRESSNTNVSYVQEWPYTAHYSVSQNRCAMAVQAKYRIADATYRFWLISLNLANWLITQGNRLAVGCCWWHRPCGWRVACNFPVLHNGPTERVAVWAILLGRDFWDLSRSLGRMLSTTTGSDNYQLSFIAWLGINAG